MRKTLAIILSAATVAGATLPNAAMAAPFAAPRQLESAVAVGDAGGARLERVYHRRWHGGYGYRRHRGAGVAAGIIGGLAAGAIIGGAIANDRARAADRADWDDYCFSKYRSYDPASGTYLGYDGYRHPCQ